MLGAANSGPRVKHLPAMLNHCCYKFARINHDIESQVSSSHFIFRQHFSYLPVA